MSTLSNFTCQDCDRECDGSEAAAGFKQRCAECVEEMRETVWEDPMRDYARERAEAWEDRRDLWRRQY